MAGIKLFPNKNLRRVCNEFSNQCIHIYNIFLYSSGGSRTQQTVNCGLPLVITKMLVNTNLNYILLSKH
jgi:hypothetical protein